MLKIIFPEILMWYKEVLQMARVLIIDPHPVTKEGIKKVILQHTNLEICPDVTTHDESMLSLQKNKPDLIIMETILKGYFQIDRLWGKRLSQQIFLCRRFYKRNQSHPKAKEIYSGTLFN